MMKITFINVIFFLLIFVSCTSDVDINPDNPKIKAELEKKRIEFINEMKAICQSDAIKKAEIYVDSMVAADFFMELSGTIPFPEKPLKPVFEGPIVIKDTIKAGPIIK